MGNWGAHLALQDERLREFQRHINYDVNRYWYKNRRGLMYLGIEKDDLFQGVYVRLCVLLQERKNEYDENKAQFKTWFQSQIHGALVDTVRKYQWTCQIYERYRKRCFKEGTEPINFYVLGASQIKRISKDNEEEYDGTIDDVFAEQVSVDKTEELNEHILAKQKVRVIYEELKNMPEQYQYIFKRYFEDETIMKDIGDELNLTESRISQIVLRIRTHLERVLRIRGLDTKADKRIHHHSRSEPDNCDTFLFNNSRGVSYAL